VASRWRIRHKLLLGLGLVVCIMALLLCGTLRGLWSYYMTTLAIRAKVQELGAAEEVRSAVAELTAPENAAGLVKSTSLLPEAIKKVEVALDAYEEKLEETLAQTRDPLAGEHEQGIVAQLRSHLDAFRENAEKRNEARFSPLGTEETVKRADLEAVGQQSKDLRLGALDLKNHIGEELAQQMGGKSRSHYQATLWIIVPSSVLGLLFMAGLMRSFYAWVFNPIRDLEAGVGRVAKGDFRHRIELHSGDEMEDLANAFNDMLERLRELYDDLARQVNERSRQLVRSERLASVGFLAAGVAHEINNPLASIAFCSEALEARLGELMRHLRATTRASEEHDIFSKYLKMIQEESFRCKTITERLLEFSRTGERRREATDLKDLVQAVLDVTQHLPNHRGKHIVFEAPPEKLAGRITAWVNGEEIKSVILNLVVNGLESMDEGGRLLIRLGQRDDLAELRFTDTGCGMTREVLENIFEPFFTRSRSGKGTGLGLTISHLIISQHGGEIEADSPGPNQGSTFVVRLPRQPTEAAAELTIGGEQPAVRALRGQAA
jgi:signal transduction histidine kinase